MDQWAGRTNEPDGKRRHNKVISLSRALFPKSIQPEHYYGSALIHDLREKTSAGKWAEEFLCARAIDEHPKIKHWVRNVEKEPRLSFKLPVAGGYFYPDFVCELTDGRLLVVEYKGQHLQDNADSREKAAVGAHWEKTSGGQCLFLMATADNNGANVSSQINLKIDAR